jgi:DNA primase
LVNHGTKEVDPGVAPGVTLMQYVLGEIDGINFSTPIYQEILTICREKFLQGVVLDTAYFISHHIAEIQNEAINLASEKHVISEEWMSRHEIFVPTEEDKLADMAYTNILRLKKSFNDEYIKTLMKQLTQAKDPQEQNRLLSLFMEAKEVEKQIAKELGTVVVR